MTKWKLKAYPRSEGRNMSIDSHKRSIIKAAIYKAGSILLLAGLAWLLTRDIMRMSLITISYEMIAVAGYYVNERLWERVKWGRKQSLQTIALNSSRH